MYDVRASASVKTDNSTRIITGSAPWGDYVHRAGSDRVYVHFTASRRCGRWWAPSSAPAIGDGDGAGIGDDDSCRYRRRVGRYGHAAARLRRPGKRGRRFVVPSRSSALGSWVGARPVGVRERRSQGDVIYPATAARAAPSRRGAARLESTGFARRGLAVTRRLGIYGGRDARAMTRPSRRGYMLGDADVHTDPYSTP